eukprot:scaffold5138_cov170-Amphora_coffeaeformis.AAC.2
MGFFPLKSKWKQVLHFIIGYGRGTLPYHLVPFVCASAVGLMEVRPATTSSDIQRWMVRRSI